MSKLDAVVNILQKSGWRVSYGAENLSIGCPLARYSPIHRSSVDSRPSMGIKVEQSAVLVHCFTCGFRAGQLSYLYRRLESHDSSWGMALTACLQMESEYLIDGILSLQSEGFRRSKAQEASPLSEDLWNPYSRKFCRYLESRGVSYQTGVEWGVGHDQANGRALIPVRDVKGNLWGAVGRTYRNEKPKYLNYFGMSKGEHLLGSHMIGSAKSIVVVEGALDALRAYQAFKQQGLLDQYACVSVMGASVSKNQAKSLISCAHEVILAFDNDEAGQRGRSNADKDLSKLIMVRHANIGALNKKDFGECDDAEIIDLIENAELISL